MAYRSNHLNRKTSVTYVYEAVAHWDKEKKQARNKQVCIGKIDPKTGEFVLSERLDPKQSAVRDPEVTACATVVGASVLLDHLCEQLGLEEILKACFPKEWDKILSMAYFLTIRGGALSHCEGWSKGHSHPHEKPLTHFFLFRTEITKPQRMILETLKIESPS